MFSLPLKSVSVLYGHEAMRGLCRHKPRNQRRSWAFACGNHNVLTVLHSETHLILPKPSPNQNKTWFIGEVPEAHWDWPWGWPRFHSCEWTAELGPEAGLELPGSNSSALRFTDMWIIRVGRGHGWEEWTHCNTRLILPSISKPNPEAFTWMAEDRSLDNMQGQLRVNILPSPNIPYQGQDKENPRQGGSL